MSNHLALLDERGEIIETILRAMCDSENQPHQWIDDWGSAWDMMFIATIKDEVTP